MEIHILASLFILNDESAVFVVLHSALHFTNVDAYIHLNCLVYEFG